MKRMNFKRASRAALVIGGAIAATSTLAQSQGSGGMGSGGMMGGYGASWMGGYGYGGVLMLVLLVVVVAGLVAWFVAQNKR